MSLQEDTLRVEADQVIDDCMEAYRLCRRAAAYCVDQGGDLATLHRLQALEDCAEVSLLTGNFLLRASRYYRQAATLCIRVAGACAAAIEEQEGAHAPLRATYAACHRLREACTDVLGQEVPADATGEERRWDETIEETFPGSDAPPPPTQL